MIEVGPFWSGCVWNPEAKFAARLNKKSFLLFWWTHKQKAIPKKEKQGTWVRNNLIFFAA